MITLPSQCLNNFVVSLSVSYSTDSGWDNPFRPDGDLSREADEIVGLIKEGKPITPTSVNGSVKITVDERDGAIAVQAKPQLAAAPPTSATTTASSPKKGTNGTANCEKAGVVEVQRTIVSPSTGGEVEPVIIKKKPKCKCCVIQ